MPLLDELLEPIAGENPAGENLRYDPVYDQIKQARTEEIDAPQGEWRRARKTADHRAVIKLATEALTKRTKDLQIAAWLTEAWLRQDGASGLKDGLILLRELLERFWDHVYPEIEDGDVELRAAPLVWVGSYLDPAVRTLPLNGEGHDLIAYRESRRIPTEAEAESEYEKGEARRAALEEGKLDPESFDQAFAATPKSWYKELVADLDGALEALSALDAAGNERFGGEAPGYGKLRQALEEVRPVADQLLARKLEIEPDPPEAVEPVAATGAESQDASSTAAVPAPAPEAGALVAAAAAPVARLDTREGALAQVAAAARFLRQADPADPAPYLMLRGLRRGELGDPGGELDPKLLVAPSTDARAEVKAMALDNRWQDLLDAAEEIAASPGGRAWLDLHRYVITACDALGGEYDGLAAALRSWLRSLLQDFPELPAMSLMDDSPAASEETRAWLQEEGFLAPAGAAEEGGDGAPAAARPRLRRSIVERAVERARAGEHRDAVSLLLYEPVEDGSARSRFLRRSEAAAILLDAGMPAVALPILQEMIEVIDRHSLESWEDGRTVARSLGLLYRCLAGLDHDPSVRDELYLRICRLDPLQAIQLAAGS